MSPQQSDAQDRDTEGIPVTTPSEASSGTVIGPYHLLQPIGYGGMGEVWLAEQKEPVRRRVALKLIKAGMDTREVLARFEAERQALALMDHPAIAKVFDAGSTPQGRPYFAMEYVIGISITKFCDRHQLTIPQRLELFVRVCEGVQHAHQKAIIHRDLKPSNILVSEVDGKPLPRIIDFGVAKATSQRLTDDTMFTRVGAIVGTPGYISPEQADSSGGDVDTRTDVYSLGVIFYELLAGMPPLELRRVAFEEFLRRLREEDPSKPSTKIRTQAPAALTEVAQKRQTEPPALAKQLRGDLDSIALKALEKDRSRRYASPSDFAADIGRYLKNEPVLAVPPSLRYRARKFVRRHRLAVTAAIAVALPLFALAISIPIEGRRVVRERDKALASEKTANQVSSFLLDLFRVADPTRTTRGAITARQTLDRGAETVRTELDGQPLVQARMMETLGRVYDSLGLYDQALALLDSALATRRKLLGEDHLEVASSLAAISTLWFHRGEFVKGIPMEEEALRIRNKLLGPEDLEVAATLHSLANAYMSLGKFAEAERYCSRCLSIREKKLSPNDDALASTVNTLGAIAYRKGNLAKAREFWERTLAMRQSSLPADHPLLAQTLNNLALIHIDTADPEGARPLLERAIAIQEKTLGQNHADLAFALNNFGDVLMAAHDYRAARERYQRAVDILEASSPNHPELGNAFNGLGRALLETGEVAKAGAAFQHSVNLYEKALGKNPADAAGSVVGMARCDQKEKRYDRSQALFERALALCRHPDGTYDRRAASYLADYAVLLRDVGQARKAKEMQALAQSLRK